MKSKSVFLIAIASFAFCLKSQGQLVKSTENNVALTIGILQGGGSLVGADLEFMPSHSLGLQVGAGYQGYGGGINFHFNPTVRSSFLSLQYWHQGLSSSQFQSVIGPTFVYRAPKWFTAQIGIGYLLDGNGSTYDALRSLTPVILMYSIGAYFPL